MHKWRSDGSAIMFSFQRQSTMLHVKLGYSFTASASARTQLENPLFDMLAAIHRSGSLAQAARELNFSYRHVWGAIKEWEHQLGAALIDWERGKRARLSRFGEKLLFAEQLARTRLAPQIENLVAELERGFALAFDRGAHVVSMMASHDLALPRLKDFLAQDAQLHLDLQFAGSVACLEALSREDCMLAGFHISEDRAPGSVTQKTFKRLLKPGRHKLINFVGREQGLMVAPRNPHRIAGVADLADGRLRFVNREPGSGTRVEFDQILSRLAISPASIAGYERCEPTHLAVAAAIAAGQADAGMGIRAAAVQFGLDFVPLLREQYYFACLKSTLEEPAMQRLLLLLRGAQWRSLVDDLAGYEPSNAGQVVALKEALPWYQFKTEKPHTRTSSHHPDS